MDKQIVNEDQFIELCNQELRNHQYFEKGMKNNGVPDDASGSELSGYNWEGPDSMPIIVSSVVNKVKENYELRVTPRKKKI
jgi:hypothetical protein